MHRVISTRVATSCPYLIDVLVSNHTVSVPSAALLTPPDTGASTNFICRHSAIWKHSQWY